MSPRLTCAVTCVLLGLVPTHTQTVPKPTVIEAIAEDAGQEGFATYYAWRFHGRRTASGVQFDNTAMVAAHPTLPFGTRARVTNLGNDKTVTVEIVDRGPARYARRSGVILDLSRAAAEELDFLTEGRTRVRVVVIDRP